MVKILLTLQELVHPRMNIKIARGMKNIRLQEKGHNMTTVQDMILVRMSESVQESGAMTLKDIIES